MDKVMKSGAALAVFVAIVLAPSPNGLSDEGQRALAVMAFAVVLWITDALPVAITGLAGVVLLVLVKAVPDVNGALYGFSQPVVYFLVGILTMGLAVQRSGLAERAATYLITLARGRPRALYSQMLFSFAALTFMLPSASTRSAIMVHVYEDVLARWQVPQGAPLNKAIMMALGSLNRLGSTALLAGGITPVVASALLGDFSWTDWFRFMAVPFYSLLVVGGVLLYIFYRSGFHASVHAEAQKEPRKMAAAEIRTGLIVLGAAVLWFTDFAHGLAPAVPALIAMVIILTPGIGVLEWSDFERNLGWSNFFAIAASLSLANALVTSGAAAWLSDTMVSGVQGLRDTPYLALLALAGTAAVVRLAMPNVAGYLALVIPIAMATGDSLGLNPLVCGMAVVVVGDAVVYYPAQATGSIFVYSRANMDSAEVFRFGVTMAIAAIAVLFAIVLPYWNLVGESLMG